MNTLNETILANLRAELDLSLANHKTMRTAYLAAEIAKLEKLVETGICKKCGGSMKTGKAIEQTYYGKPDFIGSDEVVTMSPGGKGNLIDCAKCEKCGWSVSVLIANDQRLREEMGLPCAS